MLLLQAGDSAPETRLLVGNYDRWFLEALYPTPVRFLRVAAHLGEKIPPPDDFDAVIMTGSPQSATTPSTWMLRAADYLRGLIAGRVPFLGVCFGHQLLALAAGAQVIRNPSGREIGTIEVELTPEGRADPLFLGLGDGSLRFQATHEDIAETLPAGARLLATNAACRVQAMRVGPKAWGVQFHPELSTAGMRGVITARAALLQGRAPALLAGVRHSPHGSALLRNFLRAAA